jgi:hypothetical protein
LKKIGVDENSFPHIGQKNQVTHTTYLM